jgi:putative acetyltransferase
MVEIRSERPEDVAAIRHVHEQAFGGPGEAHLVELLREASKAAVLLVAVHDGQIVGHVLFSQVTIDPEQAGLNGVGLAPVGVLPEFQNKGIGSSLVRAGLEACKRAGHDVVVVLGHTDYYPRFGFSQASEYGLGNEYNADEHFMALELREGALAQVRGVVKYQPEFNQAGC